MTPIPVHPVLGPMPVAPAPATPGAVSRLPEEIRRQSNISLAVIKANPVPQRGKGNE
jgi:hypothetical protein